MTGLTSGPWTGKVYPHGAETWTLTLDELRACLWAAPWKVAMCRALGVDSFSHRKADRALQLLRQAGLIRWTGSATGWRRTELGDREAAP